MRRAERTIRQLACALCLLVACFSGHASRARADELSDFEAARTRYERHDYTRAVEAFRALVGSEPPRITNALLVLESRKYFAASLLFRGAEPEARAQFRLLLQQEPDYTLDPLGFPGEVVALFEDVKSDIRRELERRREQEQRKQREEEREAEVNEQRRRENLAQLRLLAEQRSVRTEHSRWLASVPFGVGQLQNGHRRLGLALAVSQGLTAATSLVSYAVIQSVDRTPSITEERDTKARARLLFTVNVASFAAFAALAVAGIVDAHVRFVPSHVRALEQPLPEDLDRWVREEAARLATPHRF